ncbi:MAG: DcrB-related protein [Polyangiaceae bacterium]|nr:DcrB-related protein [Polyangiaceae bacterium]
MTAYYFDEGAFELPGGLSYIDRSVHMIEAPGGDGAELGLTMERKPILPGKSLLDVVGEIRREQEVKLRGHISLAEGECRVDGLAALETRLRWRHPKGPVYHRQVHVALGNSCLTMTASSRWERAAACDAWMDALLSTLRFRPRGQ